MSKSLLLLLLLIAFQATAQKDSLSKYTVPELIKKNDTVFYYQGKLVRYYTDEILRRKISDSVKSFVYNRLSGIEGKNIETSILYLNKALTYARKANNPDLIRENVGDLGDLYALKNDFKNAMICIEEVKKIEESGVKLDYPLPRIARIYFLMGDFKKNTSIYVKEVKKIEAYKNSHPDIGKEESYKLKIFERSAYTYLVTAYTYEKKLDSASNYIKKIRELSKDIGHTVDDMWSYESFYFIVSRQYDKAIASISQSKKYIACTTIATFKARYYLAMCYKEKKQFKKALEYAELALTEPEILLSFQNPELELYKIASESAEELGDLKKTALYSKKYVELSKKTNYAQKAAFMAELYQVDVIKPLDKQLIEKKKTASIYGIISIAVVLLASATIAYAIAKAKRDKKKFLAVIARLEHQEVAQQELAKTQEEEIRELEIEEEQNIEIKKSVPSAMSDEVDKRIAKRLDSFERRELFISPNISLSSMSKDFNTNAAYLSAAIKKHRNNTFNGYINDLRIDYIVLKLKNNPEYSNYKIAYLAEASGFASYVVFHRAFLQRTGISPSKFISYLNAGEN